MVARLLFRLIVAGFLCVGTAASAFDLGNLAPAPAPKSSVPAQQSRILVRQGGDTMATATPIAGVPYVGSGTTEGFANDYDTGCPNVGSDSPDVVYSFTRPPYGTLTIDLCGSDYDTKIYVMSDEGQIFDCNDDYYYGGVCGQQTSRIDNLWLPPGETYYLVIDGAGGAAGQYEFEMRRWDTDLSGSGDTLLDPFVIDALPYTGSGTTADFANDYDYACPYTGSTSADVVYRFVPSGDLEVDIDLCLSSYDTKVYVYQDGGTTPIACNDDFYFAAPCFVYSSFLADVPMNLGHVYYIVVDGYGGTSGEYVLTVTGEPYVPCILECPNYGCHEGEPPLNPDYVDHYNGGCNSDGHPFQPLPADSNGNLTLCARAGWNSAGRDTDWFIVHANYWGGPIELTVDAEWPVYVFELLPQDCSAVAVEQIAEGGPCVEGHMTITGYGAGAHVWVWGGSQTYVPPTGAPTEHIYLIWFSGLNPGSVATEATTWSTLKALYD